MNADVSARLYNSFSFAKEKNELKKSDVADFFLFLPNKLFNGLNLKFEKYIYIDNKRDKRTLTNGCYHSEGI